MNTVDTDYFSKKLKLVIRDIAQYTPNELARELARLARTASDKILSEPEFNKTAQHNDTFKKEIIN